MTGCSLCPHALLSQARSHLVVASRASPIGKKIKFRDLEHSRLAGSTATFTAVITSKSNTCVHNMVWIEVC